MGWNWSAQARASLTSGGGQMAWAGRVDVLHAGQPVYTLEAIGGSMKAEAASPVRRSLSRVELVDPTGDLSGGDVKDLLDPYECEIAPYRGVRWTNNVLGVLSDVEELAPLGVFGLTSRTVRDAREGLVIGLSGQDRAMAYQGPMSSALAVPNGTPVEEAIARLLLKRNSRLSLQSMVTGFTTGALVFEPDSDVWAEASKLAESVGARLFHDRTGQCVLAPAGALSDHPVASYAEGDGLLLSVDRAEDSDTIRNAVRAENATSSIVEVVRDNDPSSPTYYLGRYGERTYVLKNPHLGSPEQAQQAAVTRLAYELGRSETVSFTAVPDPGLDVDEVVTVHRPRIGLTHRGVITASIDMPLGPEDPMRVDCRQSRLARDGQVLPLQELAR